MVSVERILQAGDAVFAFGYDPLTQRNGWWTLDLEMETTDAGGNPVTRIGLIPVEFVNAAQRPEALFGNPVDLYREGAVGVADA